MVNPNELEHISEDPHVSGDDYVRKTAHVDVYYVKTDNGASYDIVIGTLRTYRNKETGEFVHLIDEDHQSTVFKDEIESYFNEQGEKKRDVVEPLQPLDQAIENAGKVVMTTSFDAYGIVP